MLQVNSNPVIKVTLQLGELAETLTVQGQAPLVETRNPAVGQVITNEQVEALPLEGPQRGRRSSSCLAPPWTRAIPRAAA